MSMISRSLVILAGGRSSRLGHDKTLVEVGGRPLLLRLLDATPMLTDVVLAVREPGSVRAVLVADAWESGDETRPGPDPVESFTRGNRRIRVVMDPEPDLGPVAGLASGLALAEGRLALVLAADLPFVNATFAEQILDILVGEWELDAVVPFVSGQAQPLCAAYRRSVVESASAYLEETKRSGGSASMSGLLGKLSVRYIGGDSLAGSGDLATVTRDINTAEDLAWAVRIAEEAQA